MPKKYIKRADGSLRIISTSGMPSRTQKQFKDQCDVNNIIAKYKTTGEFTHRANTSGFYADMTDIGDYTEIQEKLRRAEDTFLQLPAKIRARFANDPSKLLQFVDDYENNYDEGVKLGIFNKKEQQQVEANNNDDQTTMKNAKTQKAPKQQQKSQQQQQPTSTPPSEE